MHRVHKIPPPHTPPPPHTHTHTHRPPPPPTQPCVFVTVNGSQYSNTKTGYKNPGVHLRKQKTRQLYGCTSRTRLYIKNNPLMAATLSGYRRRGQGQQRQAIDRPEGQRMALEEATVCTQIQKISDSLPPTHIAITFYHWQPGNCDPHPTPMLLTTRPSVTHLHHHNVYHWQPGQM